MLNFETCKNILNEGERTYTDEEVKQISELLMQFALLTVETFHHLENQND